ncbi:MAG: hypothetical protein HY727_19680 [Candidatus Rokubacteria bacterium]|nr:hypothetical protein [Candidatus Rokubacteria bacterium]
MTAPVDPNDVLMTGENSFIRLSPDGGKTMSDRVSHWRVLWCPAGTGHALFVQSQLIDGHVRLYSDNAGVARWLQRTIEALLYPAFADTSLPVIAAHFARAGDPRSTATETAVAGADRIHLAWWDCIDPFVLTLPPGFNNRPIGVFSTFFPARSAQIEMNGRVAAGQPWPETRGDRQGSSACLAWSETWVKPRG